MLRSLHRLFIGVSLAALVAAACSSDDDGASAGSTPPIETTSGTDGTAAEFPRQVAGGFGDVEIPTKPVRVVATSDRDQLDVLLAMGVVPVQAGYTGDYEVAAPWLDAELLDGVDMAEMPSAFEPNLEYIASARPDLIVDAWAAEESHDSLSQIAPTIQIKLANEDTWKEAQLLAGQALGEDTAAAAAVADTEAAIADAAELLADHHDMTVALAFESVGELVMIPGDEIGGRIIAELGMPVLDTPDGVSGRYSLEEIPSLLADADIIVSFDYGGREALESNPLFATLPAVQSGRYVSVPLELSAAAYQESSLSLRWAAPQFAELIGRAARGAGDPVG